MIRGPWAPTPQRLAACLESEASGFDGAHTKTEPEEQTYG